MDNFLFILNAILPLFLVCAVGMLLRYALKFSDSQASVVNRVCYYALLPSLLFRNAYNSDFSAIETAWPYVYAVMCLVLTSAIVILVAKRTVADPRQGGGFTHSVIRTNTALFGLPLAIRYLGEAESLPAVLMTTVMLVALNLVGMTALSIFSPTKKNDFLGILRSVTTSPLIIALALGMLCKGIRLEIPSFVDETLKTLAGASSPMAMLAIGMGFNLATLKSDRKLVAWGTALRVGLIPLVVTVIAILIGFRGTDLFCIYLAFGVPTAANSAVISYSMDCDGELAGEIVLTTTLASLFTMVAGLMVLEHFCLI